VDNVKPFGLIDHNAGRSDTYPSYVGENVQGGSNPPTAQGVVDGWVSEVQYYDYDSNSCEPMRSCGHYTQVVWADSTKLGCARFNCPELTYGQGVVCNYAPGGNIGDQKPY
jgi:pathogenesis-related protein 1